MTTSEDKNTHRRRMERLIHALPRVERSRIQAHTPRQGIEVDFRTLASDEKVVNRPVPPECDPRNMRGDNTLGFWMFGLPGIFWQAAFRGATNFLRTRR